MSALKEPSPKLTLAPKLEPEPEAERPDNTLWWILALWYFISKLKNKP